MRKPDPIKYAVGCNLCWHQAYCRFVDPLTASARPDALSEIRLVVHPSYRSILVVDRHYLSFWFDVWLWRIANFGVTCVFRSGGGEMRDRNCGCRGIGRLGNTRRGTGQGAKP